MTPVDLDHTPPARRRRRVHRRGEERHHQGRRRHRRRACRSEDVARDPPRPRRGGRRPRIVFEGNDFGVLAREVAVGGQQLSIRGLAGEYADLFLPLHGAHQAQQRCAAAVAAVEAFLGGGEQRLDPDVRPRPASPAMTSPGRLEIVRRSPTVLVDAAHNPHGARSLGPRSRRPSPSPGSSASSAIVADKDAAGMLEMLEPALDHVVVTRTSSPRAMRPERPRRARRRALRRGPGDRRRRPARRPRAGRDLAEEDGMGGGVIATGSVITAAEVRMLLGHTDV